MTILNLFIDFINKILSIKILDYELITWLLSFSSAIIIFKIITIISNSDSKNTKKKRE